MELNYKLIGSHVREVRLKKNIQQNDLARQINRVPSYISDIERGLAHPSLGVLFSIAEILGVTLNDLVYGSPKDITDSQEARIMYIYENASESRKDFLYKLITTTDEALDRYDEAVNKNNA